MSYCRWSSDDFQCDVYVYASDQGYTTHVAGRRPAFAKPLPPLADYPDAWFVRHEVVRRMVEVAELVDIGLEHDGESFYDYTPDECAERLEYLRSCGYNVPQYAIDELREEAAEERRIRVDSLAADVAAQRGCPCEGARNCGCWNVALSRLVD
jgi:hypothetical protein